MNTLSPVHARREFEAADPTAGAARWLAICFLFTALAALSAWVALA